MNNKDSNKRNKKKLIILVLLLFIIIGISGYGAYSYFYTSGSFSGSDEVTINSFDPQITINNDFVGNGGSVTLTCPNSETGNETIECTGSIGVLNNGGSAITVSTSNVVASLDAISSDAVSATAGTPTFSWSNTTIEAGSTETATITVPVDLDSYFGSSGSSSYRSSAYTGEAIEVTVTFDLTATQVHD